MKKVFKVFLVALFAIMFSNIAQAQEQKNFTIDKLSIEGRTDFDFYAGTEEPEGCIIPGYSKSGFDGKYLNFEIKGSFLNDFSYRLRQRFDMADKSSKTDIMILSYHAHKNWSFTVGKMSLAVGGWEYDLAPIDVYIPSQFWNTFNCYDVGAQVEFHTNDKNHDIIFQITNSTFYENGYNKFDGKYAYNLIWYGRMGKFSTSYSVNMMEQKKGEYINYIALGNMFDFGKLDFYIDFMNRGFLDQEDYFLGDFTLIGAMKYAFTDKFTLLAKGGYDRNKHSYFKEVEEDGIMIQHPMLYDMTVRPGVEYTFAGLGFESFPYKGNKSIRLHGFVALNSLCEPLDDMINPNSFPKLSLQFNLGLTWRINFAK